MHGFRVIVVDDERRACRAYAQTLTKLAGYSVKQAFSGEHALALMRGEEFDVALVDLVMPGMSGLSLAEIIRRRWTALAIIVSLR